MGRNTRNPGFVLDMVVKYIFNEVYKSIIDARAAGW